MPLAVQFSLSGSPFLTAFAHWQVPEERPCAIPQNRSLAIPVAHDHLIQTLPLTVIPLHSIRGHKQSTIKLDKAGDIQVAEIRVGQHAIGEDAGKGERVQAERVRAIHILHLELAQRRADLLARPGIVRDGGIVVAADLNSVCPLLLFVLFCDRAGQNRAQRVEEAESTILWSNTWCSMPHGVVVKLLKRGGGVVERGRLDFQMPGVGKDVEQTAQHIGLRGGGG